MQEIIIYRADDGTDFEDEWDCKHYEWQQSCEKAEYTLLSHHFQILPADDTNSYEDACFIFVPTQASAFALSNNWDTDMINADCPSFPGEETRLLSWVCGHGMKTLKSGIIWVRRLTS